MYIRHSTRSELSWPTLTGSSRQRKWIVDRHPGQRRISLVLVLLLLVVTESTSTSRPAADRRRHQRSYRYAGEHIHVGPLSDGDCPVRPPCYCTDSVTTTHKAPATTADGSPWGADVVVVAQRIACDSFSDVRRRRGKWSRSRSRSRPASLRRFPRFVESNVAVERHVLLSYSGLTSIPGAAFHAIKVCHSRTTRGNLSFRVRVRTPGFNRRLLVLFVFSLAF